MPMPTKFLKNPGLIDFVVIPVMVVMKYDDVDVFVYVILFYDLKRISD